MKHRIKWFHKKVGGKSYKQAWIGYSYRKENGVPDFKRQVSLANLDDETINIIDKALRNANANDSEAVSTTSLQFLGSLSIGAPWVASRIAELLGVTKALDCLDEKHRLPLLAMILDRVVSDLPHSKSSLAEILPGSALERVLAPKGINAKLHDFYTALEKIHEKQNTIQKLLFGQRAKVERMFLYDITSSYMEGEKCPLAKFGYNRDGKKGKLQIVIGLLTDSEGCPIAVEVFDGNTADQSTVMQKIDQLRADFGIDEMVFIGDRGMVTSARRKDLEADEYEKVKYISALKRQEFFKFLADRDHPLQPTLFDRHNLGEVEVDGVRYIISFNPEKESKDRKTRNCLIDKTEEKLEKIRQNIDTGRLKSSEAIAKRLYRWLNKWNMERFFTYEYGEGQFHFCRNEEEIKKFEAIDGFYVLTTDVDKTMETEEVRARYKSLSQVEQAFRAMKTTDLFLRPIRHWNPERVKGHVFICMLAYMISWKARKIFTPFLKKEEDSEKCGKNLYSSLRSIWEKLNSEMQIGKFKIANIYQEQLTLDSPGIKNILQAANAFPTPEIIKNFTVVG